jgi:hypothetical protein
MLKIETSQTRLQALVARVSGLFRDLLKNTALAMVAIVATTSIASAETLLMPKRDARTTAPVVVWGVHTQAAGTACTLDFGDSSAVQNCTGVDRSYIAYPHTYAVQGTYTVKLTVGAETATTTIQSFNPAAFADGGVAGNNNRALGINMAIQDGLRFLWTNQINRAANFPAGISTYWQNSAYPYADTSLVVVAFENQGYRLTGNVAPTGIYEKYIVRRGINYVLSNLVNVNLAVTPGGNNPCVGVPAATFADCKGLAPPGDTGYTTALAILGFAGSGALTRINTEVAGITNGQTYGAIMQRLVNALAWGQNDSGTGQGGWYYNFNSTILDGSTVGWDVLALLDASAAGATVPAWVLTEFKKGFDKALNTDGSFDYQGDGNPAANNNVGPQKNGIGLQGTFLLGETAGARVDAVKNNVNSWWSGVGIGGNVWGTCGPIAGAANKGCGYTMFNNFKGLKLQNIITLPGVTRPAGPGAQPAGDWYADYQDWLVANQTTPTTTAGGSWSTMTFSCCANGTALNGAIAELILAPVALVAPDPGLFSTVGLSPAAANNPVGANHTVTAFTQAANGAAVPGVTIDFRVLTGPNAGKTGTGTTGANGKTSFTYVDTGGAGIDTIQAFIGASLSSNQVTVTWANATLACDVNGDGKVTNADLTAIRAKNGQNASGPNDPYDPNRDGKINVADVRYCQLRLTPP